tara:strand:- start:4016 stop:4387 length:372 start_codon:yes stop_codon:yes gene_type:complete
MTNKEKLFEEVLGTLGAKNISSKTQKKNGTSMWKLKTGETVAEYSTGYVRKIVYWTRSSDNKKLQDTCWQLNPTKTYPASWKSPVTKDTYTWQARERIMLRTREERLEKILNYTTKKLLKKVA